MARPFKVNRPRRGLFDMPLYREFAQLDAHGRLSDESTILRFRHRLEKHKLADQILATVNFYNAVRLHSTLGNLSPLAFEH